MGLTGFAFGMPHTMFGVIPAIVTIGFVIVFITILVRAVQGAAKWKRNNASPVLTVDAQIVTKRADVRYHRHHHGSDHAMHHTSSSTTYYATFQVESGDRLELKVPDMEYGLLVEGDRGKLTFQGTRYQGFQRQ